MSAPRQRRFAAFEKLSDEGKAIVIEGIEQGWTQDTIQTELACKTQEWISNGSLGRFVKHYKLQAEQEGRVGRNAVALVSAMKQNDVEAEDYVTALLALGMRAQEDAAAEVDLTDLMRLQRDFNELNLKRKDLELKSRRVDAMERELELKAKQVEMQQRKLERIAAEAADLEKAMEAGGSMSPELKKKIREVYGLATEGEAA